MKTEYRNKPKQFEIYNSYQTLINYNIVESKDEHGDKYECDQIIVNNPISYKDIVVALIRTKYTLSDEIGLLRQADKKKGEFWEYNIFVEECKRLAKDIWNSYS